MTDAEIKSVIEGLDEITGYSCEQMSLFDNDVFIRKMANDAMSVIRELKAEIDRLKQGNLVDVDKLREKLGFAESCEKCKKDSWRCQRDTYFSEKDFCVRLDFAIEELIKEGR